MCKEEGNKMINDDIMAIKDDIVRTIGDDCERVYLFGSYAYGTPRIGGKNPSDYDFFVVFKDGTADPWEKVTKIYRSIPHDKNVDIMPGIASKFDYRKTQPTIERKIAREGVLLYDS
jgi:predicted nucleotidyltransferase